MTDSQHGSSRLDAEPVERGSDWERMPSCDQGCRERRVFYHFRFSAQEEAIAPVVATVSELARLRFENGEDADIGLALQEAVANAIVHGSRGDASKPVECWVACDARDMTIVVRDSGPGFDPGSVRDPLGKDGLAASHGRGVLMMRRLMDDVHFRQNGAEVHMRKRRAPVSG